jgi:hypothetical protein
MSKIKRAKHISCLRFCEAEAWFRHPPILATMIGVLLGF